MGWTVMMARDAPLLPPRLHPIQKLSLLGWGARPPPPRLLEWKSLPAGLCRFALKQTSSMTGTRGARGHRHRPAACCFCAPVRSRAPCVPDRGRRGDAPRWAGALAACLVGRAPRPGAGAARRCPAQGLTRAARILPRLPWHGVWISPGWEVGCECSGGGRGQPGCPASACGARAGWQA